MAVELRSARAWCIALLIWAVAARSHCGSETPTAPSKTSEDAQTGQAKDMPRPIASLEDLKREGAVVERDSGRSEQRSEGRYRKAPGLFVVEGKVSGRGTKWPASVLYCDWYSFGLMADIPETVFDVGDEEPHIRVVAELYRRDPYVEKSSKNDIVLQNNAPSPKDGTKVAGRYYLTPLRVWVEVTKSKSQ